ncbi:MAG: endonuclease/exonuclease/phosphatase family protein [Bryobacteraceae bacterium]
MKRILAAVLFACSLCALQAAETLRVMSFNVRLPLKSDGPDYWDNRRDLLVETIRRHSPDLIGTQELFYIQGQYIAEKLPHYEWFGLSRRGNHEDEHMGVFYRKDRLRVVESGNYWLSETPDAPASMSWGINFPRMVTWAVFEDLRTKRRFHCSNTHFPHRDIDEQARVNCAGILASRLRARPKEEVLIVTGDFNTDVASRSHQILTREAGLTDAWQVAPRREGPRGTFHAFKGTAGEARIDWILFRGPLQPVLAETITDNQDGRYPSDHFPVLVVFEWR